MGGPWVVTGANGGDLAVWDDSGISPVHMVKSCGASMPDQTKGLWWVRSCHQDSGNLSLGKYYRAYLLLH